METPNSQAKMAVAQGHRRILNTFAAVPDERLTWSPASTSRSALKIVAHCGFSTQFFASAIRGDAVPPAGSIEEIQAMMDKMAASITSREQATSLLAESVGQVQAALDSVTPAALQTEVKMPLITVTMMQLIYIPGAHLSNHAAQIDYLQTTWGDMQNHM